MAALKAPNLAESSDALMVDNLAGRRGTTKVALMAEKLAELKVE